MTKRLILIVTILFTVITTAQEGTSSPYSFYGIGLNAFKGTVENRSMGGLSIYSDSIHLNLQNPAAYGGLRLTTYTVGGSHSEITSKNSTAETNSTTTTLDYLAIGIPAGKFGFGFGLVPYSSVGYNLISRDEGNGLATSFSGSGGLNRVFLSAGYEILDNLSIGVDANYNFGNIENENILVRDGVQYATVELNRSEINGFAFNLGLNYEQMLTEKLEFRASATYTPERDLTSRNVRTLYTTAVRPDIIDVPLEDTELTLPSQYSVGAGIGRPRKWFLGAEYSNSEANRFNNRSFSREGAVYESYSKYRVGGFFIPNYNSLTSYFSRIVFRGGFRMEETGLNLQGESIDEFGISFGIGLPAGRLFTNANLGVEYGQRGTTNAGLIQEDFFNVMISLSLNDKWFIKRKFD
ncbi:membrane protein [Salinimicrobium marinum]|uniref:Membrane protein n=1 Tax=Salinimicrobium marinum TaxID=680283 RepID=A0A918VZY1_9FLAO|nr:hypothetical protein [Salinimicrobium marinum]GHA42857.1 membrane protein [Salinimicrobium marinum]